MDGDQFAIAPLTMQASDRGLQMGPARLQAAKPPAETFAATLGDAQSSRSAAPSALPEGARKAHREFEAMFLSQLLSTMFEASESGMGIEGTAGSVYAGWFSQAVADQIAARGGLGIAQSLDMSTEFRELAAEIAPDQKAGDDR